MRWPASLFIVSIYALVVSVASFESHGKRAIPRLTPKQLRALATSPDPSKNLNIKSTSSHLSKILIPRAADTANNTFVRNYIVSTLRALNWDVEEDSFTDETPYGTKKFTNVIATKDPNATMKLVLAAHFDSKYFPSYPENQFVGATDSAVPCSIMLDVAEALNPLLDRRAAGLEKMEEDDDNPPAPNTTLQLIFFDGEEAFKDWTHTDSIYGARHLADRWEKEYAAPHPAHPSDRTPTVLETIEHLVLLDLLGAENPQVSSYYLPTGWLFDAIVSVESRLDKAGLSGFGRRKQKKATASPNAIGSEVVKEKRAKSFFRAKDAHTYGFIEDDHIPFLQRGVSVLHIITNPFPRVWHTIKDDASALHAPTMKKWNLIMRIFTAEYLGLRPEVKLTAPRSTKSGDLSGSGSDAL